MPDWDDLRKKLGDHEKRRADEPRYERIEEIGRGGSAVVYRARDRVLGREVALKVLLQGPFASHSSKKRFEREVELAAHLDHRHIVTILESGISSGQYYFAMTYVASRSYHTHTRSVPGC